MPAWHKPDFAPLLPPGRHLLDMGAIERICVEPFQEPASRGKRQDLLQALGLFQLRLIGNGIQCDVIADGSFFTKKPMPDDVDVIVLIERPINDALTTEQQLVIDAINAEAALIPGVDSRAMTTYLRGDRYFGTMLCGSNAPAAMCLENSREWLKGCAVLRLLENHVGYRIRR